MIFTDTFFDPTMLAIGKIAYPVVSHCRFSTPIISSESPFVYVAHSKEVTLSYLPNNGFPNAVYFVTRPIPGYLAPESSINRFNSSHIFVFFFCFSFSFHFEKLAFFCGKICFYSTFKGADEEEEEEEEDEEDEGGGKGF